MLSRRNFVLSSILAGSASLALPRLAVAQTATSKRLLFILQRGAADGLATLAPVADPQFNALRGALAEDYDGVGLSGGLFALHPSYENVGALYSQKQALFVQAVASSYRERSHFEGQNVIESGGATAYSVRDGWLNRLLGLIPEQDIRALALSPSIPLAMQGAQSMSSYAPTALPGADKDLMARVGRIYESDPELGALFAEAQKTRAMAGDTQMRNLRDAEKVGGLAASLMIGAGAASVMMIESNGWDSHAGQRGQFSRQARQLDALLGAYQQSMAAEWNDTLVIVATEFGRTVKLNGTNGSDHGTGSAAMLLGGAVAGGKVIADWPGLRQNDLFEGRDLNPTNALEAVLAGAVAGHFGLDPELAMRTLFPARSASPVEGLIRT
ncbi:DUF1501 domain-containing protein [Pontixanthobacter aestiaquae]|uniref:DUF1501 domain-containing protein n=1 Tax=Pontixanthobacter aestiaquae TaxID=1509367 RepID=A0A844Z5M3_9SPHN|nr:DUF1501 domain-containing protein [Pontixanthobacter aestiaquae]MDN3645780.1 DUF1501 domain-containing protein [Pontixanthobacter aestiaquae]MXO83225.1 DUF1501 domain-containing protein [Pontixanthobacter aestiaquae]